MKFQNFHKIRKIDALSDRRGISLHENSLILFLSFIFPRRKHNLIGLELIGPTRLRQFHYE